jgi:hypothetical protein
MNFKLKESMMKAMPYLALLGGLSAAGYATSLFIKKLNEMPIIFDDDDKEVYTDYNDEPSNFKRKK